MKNNLKIKLLERVFYYFRFDQLEGLFSQYFGVENNRNFALSCVLFFLRSLSTTVLFYFLFFVQFLYAQYSNPFFSFFYHQFYVYPYSGLGFRKIYQNKISLEPIYFHAQIPFALALKHQSKFNLWILFVNNLKMYNEDNYPIKTPDYKISSNFSYEWDSTFQITLSFQHHSNGQKDSLFNHDGSVNFETGNFSVNSIQTYWMKKNMNPHFLLLSLQTQHLFFYFSMGYMKNFYYHHAIQIQTIFFILKQSTFKAYLHSYFGMFIQPHHLIRYKLETILQFQYNNWNLMPFIRLYYGPDEYNSRYIYQNCQLSLGLSALIPPLVIQK